MDNLRTDLQILQQSLHEALQAADRRATDMYEAKIQMLQMRMLEETNLAEYDMKRRNNEQILYKMHRIEQEALQQIRESLSVRFIETQRLLNSPSELKGQRPGARPAMLPAVPFYSEELAKTITAKLADSTARSQELDRTFPSRLVELTTGQGNISEIELREKLADLETKRKSLMLVGLVDQNANDAVLATNRIEDSTKAVLSLYVEDTRQKLAVFDDIAPKIELLTRIINKRFLYKEMSVNRKDGFVFTTPKGRRLALENLSSGEQHELVLFYELLFKASPGSFIMIDEPEISLHVVWQEHFLQDVQDITRLADVDVLIATHSPDIIDGHRDLVVELEGPMDGGL